MTPTVSLGDRILNRATRSGDLRFQAVAMIVVHLSNGALLETFQDGNAIRELNADEAWIDWFHEDLGVGPLSSSSIAAIDICRSLLGHTRVNLADTLCRFDQWNSRLVAAAFAHLLKTNLDPRFESLPKEATHGHG